MVAIILDNGWENRNYLDDHVEGWDLVRPWFKGFEVKKAVQVCGLDYDTVLELCRLMTTRRWSFHQDLGIYMGRHSTLNSYFLHILGAVCGVFQTPGGNVIPGMLMPMGFHADERNPKVWKTMVTNMPPAAAGAFPPSVMPEDKVDTDNPMASIKTESGKLEIYIPELADQAMNLNPDDEAEDLRLPDEFPQCRPAHPLHHELADFYKTLLFEHISDILSSLMI